jgi:hypothetical protein
MINLETKHVGVSMETVTSSQKESGAESRRVSKRLTPLDYANAGILKSYDLSVKEREAHDRRMEKYRVYLMKLCVLSSEVTAQACVESE